MKYKKSYFSKVYKWNINNWYLNIDFNLEVYGIVVLLEVWARADFFKAVPSKLIPQTCFILYRTKFNRPLNSRSGNLSATILFWYMFVVIKVIKTYLVYPMAK